MSLEREFTRCGHSLGLAAQAAPNIKGVLLGKTPRYAPDRAFDTLHISLELDIDFSRRAVDALCRTTVRAFNPDTRVLEFNAEKLKIASVTVDGAQARYSYKGGALKVTAPKPLEPGAEAEVAVRYRVEKPDAGLHFVYPGPHNPKNPVQLWSQSQPEDARHWYPCHDSPHEKCTSEVRATVPDGFRLVSNGTLIETVKKGGKATWHWRMDRPHSIYLISIAAGRFSEIAESWQDVPVTYYCEKGREQDARRGFGKTVKALDLFSRLTGVPYPYDKYAQVAVAEYPGGMEHTTCTTQTDACLIDARAALDCDLDTLVAHELAHQWFGDLVTCRDWSHAWLNEGFATYFEILFQADDKGQDEADHELWHNSKVYFDEDSRRYRRPIVTPAFKNPWTVFDRHTYEKGGWVVHMLRKELGERDFWRCVKHYLDKHRDGSVETSDLIQAVNEVTGRNLKWFFDQWVFRAGYPSLRAHYSWNAKARKAELLLVQTQDVSEDSPAYKFKLPARLVGRGWTKDIVIEVSEKEHRLSWPAASEPLDIQLDPELTVLTKLTLKKPHAMWLHQLRRAERAHLRHEAARAVAAWGDAASVAALEDAARREKFWGAAAEIVRALGTSRSDAAFAALSRLLKLKDPKARRAVVEQLGRYTRPEAARLVAPLARRDASVLVEAEAVRALGSQKALRETPLMEAALRKTSYRDVVAAAGVAALAATRDPRRLPALRKLSLAPHPFLRRTQAIRALQDYAALEPRCIDWIAQAGEDPDERVTLTAVNCLGALEDERALPHLEKAKSHPNARIRVYAEEAIARVLNGREPKK
jgi:aminopeptidase N